jgi:alkanesulfonate monooxygenase SsuD/methylene tetrahydromethanopterin reductase-like flavin-dependent oxidoreductase (luciferase family)
MLRLAAERADTVALGLPPQTTEPELARTVETLRAAAGGRADDLELHLNVAAVAAEPSAFPAYLERMLGGAPSGLVEKGAITLLSGSPDAIADVLCRRREEFDVSYLAVNGQFMEQFAEVIAVLRK